MVQFGAIDGASKSIILQKDAPLHESFVVSSESKEAFPPIKVVLLLLLFPFVRAN
jgi:hypothetical protein